MIKKAICLLLCIISLGCFCACESNNTFYNPDYLKKEGEISISPYLIYYTDGKKIKNLEKLDEEAAKTTSADNGGLCAYFAVSNETQYDKKITSINVDYIRDQKENDIVDSVDFDMDTDLYVPKGEYRIVECNFEKSQVLLEARLSTVTCKASASIEGCIINGNDPKSADSGYTVSVKKATFTSTGSLEGTIAIKNNEKQAIFPKQMTFSLKTESGQKISIKDSVMSLDQKINPGEMLTLSFAINQSNITKDIKENKKFNDMVVNFTIK